MLQASQKKALAHTTIIPGNSEVINIHLFARFEFFAKKYKISRNCILLKGCTSFVNKV